MDDTFNNQDIEKPKHSFNIVDGDIKVSRLGYRHQQCLIMFICLTTAYSMRACIGVAIFNMIDTRAPEVLNTTEFNDTSDIWNESLDINSARNEIEDNSGLLSALLFVPPYPKFKWEHEVINRVMFSFFWSYLLLQIPAGQLVHRFGPRYILFGALVINSVVSISFPWAAYYGGWIFAVACRILQGLSQACIIPGMYGFFGQWAPLEERSRLVGFAQSGQALGIVLGFPIASFLAASPLGWPGIFRFYGILSGLVAAIVFFMVFDTPALHPKISLAERRYIEKGLGLQEGQKKKKVSVPWCHILRCRALYFIVLSHISQMWGHSTLFREIPLYMRRFIDDSIGFNGLLIALPIIVMWFTNLFFIWFTDWIIVNKYLSVTNARKMANTIGCVPSAIGLVAFAYAPKNKIITEGILIFICAFQISTHVGSMVTHVDIAPNFAGTMMSISNFFANLVGSLAPLATVYMVPDFNSADQWKFVFIVAAGIYFFTNLAYCIFGTAEKAPWNDIGADEDTAEQNL